MPEILDCIGERNSIIIVSVSILGTIMIVQTILVVSFLIHKKKLGHKINHSTGILHFVIIFAAFRKKNFFMPLWLLILDLICSIHQKSIL